MLTEFKVLPYTNQKRAIVDLLEIEQAGYHSRCFRPGLESSVTNCQNACLSPKEVYGIILTIIEVILLVMHGMISRQNPQQQQNTELNQFHFTQAAKMGLKRDCV
jgi:hypothetical protein